MSDLIVLTSNKKQDKRAAVLALQKQFQDQGLKTAVLVTANGRVDVYSYLLNQRTHYSIPLTATKSIADFEQWVPTGYDKYIFEVTFPYSPVGAAYLDLFKNINEVVSYPLKDIWKQTVLDPRNRAASIDPSENIPDLASTPDLTPMWNIVHNRNVQTLITQCPSPVPGPYFDTAKTLHNVDKLAVESITPRMTLPKSEKKVIAVGEFPAEYWDIGSQLTWYKYQYAEFMAALRAEKYDLAVIGTCRSQNLKFQDKSKNHLVICHQPIVYLNLRNRVKKMSSIKDFSTVFSAIKQQSPLNVPLCDRDGAFSGYNNRLMINKKYTITEPVWKERNTVYCDGWISPLTLIQEKYLEVN
jgi:hypothetical protein